MPYFVKKYIFVCLLFLFSAQIIQSEDKCSNNPSACTTNEICIIATTLKNGKVLWQGESVKEYVLEAKKRNLTEEICAKKNCRYDPVYCSETLICKKATRNNNGESVWKDDFSKDYIQEAKSRGLSPLSCEIKQCNEHPNLCNKKRLCKIATTLQDGKVVWEGDFFKEFVSEAKSRGLTCDVGSNRCNSNLCNPEWWEAGVSLKEVEKEIMKAGSYVGYSDKKGRNAIHYAAQFGSPEIINLLARIGLNLNQADANYKTPLHFANYDKSKLIKALIDNGANINIQNDKGETPLHLAVNSKNTLTFKMLLNAGADTTIKNEEGKTPFDLNTEINQCVENLANCNEIRLCEISITLKDGKIAWREDFAEEYISEAKTRGLTEESCGKNLCFKDPEFCRNSSTSSKKEIYVNYQDNLNPNNFTHSYFLAESISKIKKSNLPKLNLENRTTPEIIFYNNPTKNLNQKSINQKSSEEKEWCKDNPKFCSDKQLCDRVTRLPQRSLFGIDIFEKTEIDLKYETEAFNRGLKCEMNCFTNPENCNKEMVCTLATQIKKGELVWQENYAQKFIDEAKNKNYQCLKEPLISCGKLCDKDWWKFNLDPNHSVKAIKKELASGISVDSTNADGSTPLHLAAEYGNSDVVILLLNMGANPNAKNFLDQTPLHLLGVERDPEKILAALITAGGDNLEQEDIYGYMAPEYWLKKGLQIDLSRIYNDFKDIYDKVTNAETWEDRCNSDPTETYNLCECASTQRNGINIWRGEYAKKYILQAQKIGKTCGVGEFESKLCNLDRKSFITTTYEDIKKIIDDGENVNKQCIDYDSDFGEFEYPLHKQIARGDPKIIELLINNGADIMSTTQAGRTALHHAMTFNSYFEETTPPTNQPIDYPGVVKILIENGADIMSRTHASLSDGGMNKHDTPMHSGVVYGSPNSMRLLYENGADIYAENSLGETVLSSYHNSSDYTHPMMEGMLKQLDYHAKIVGDGLKKICKSSKGTFNLEITKQKVIITHNNGEFEEYGLFNIEDPTNYTFHQKTGFLYKDYNIQIDLNEGIIYNIEKNEQIGKCEDPVDIKQATLAYSKGELESAASIFLQLAEMGDPIAQYNIGVMFENGKGIEQDYKIAQNWYKRSAEQDNIEAAYALGSIYYKGKGLEKNNEEAFKWFKIAAEKGFAAAQSNLGSLYFYGEGVSKNYEKAFEWFNKAAEQDEPTSFYNLGWMYKTGTGVIEDSLQAYKWFDLSAKKGNSLAFREIGDLFYTGRGELAQNYQKAMEAYLRVLEGSFVKGDKTVQKIIGDMYFSGLGVKQNYKKAQKWYEISADQGNAVAQYAFWWIQDKGYGSDWKKKEKNEKAFKFLKLSAEQGFAASQYSLGQLYYHGFDTPENKVEAFKWYELSAKQGFPNAIQMLAIMYHYGLGVPKNYDEALKLYQISANNGDSETQYQIAKIYYDGKITKKSYKLALKYYLLSAEQENYKAQYMLGYMYSKGRGVEKNNELAFNWYLKSANNGNAKAQNIIGIRYGEGKWVEKNLELAVKYYRLSAEQGNPIAQRNLAYMYLKGRGLEKDEKKAFQWYLYSAKQGDSKAQNSIGKSYRNGRGIEKNLEEAIKWYKLSAKKYHWAQFNLGTMYDNGEGVDKDEFQAFNWYQLAAKRGHSKSQYQLGLKYKLGSGVTKSYIYSYLWLDIASKKGNKKAPEVLEELLTNMTQKEIEIATQLSKKCKASKYRKCSLEN